MLSSSDYYFSLIICLGFVYVIDCAIYVNKYFLEKERFTLKKDGENNDDEEEIDNDYKNDF